MCDTNSIFTFLFTVLLCVLTLFVSAGDQITSVQYCTLQEIGSFYDAIRQHVATGSKFDLAFPQTRDKIEIAGDLILHNFVYKQ